MKLELTILSLLLAVLNWKVFFGSVPHPLVLRPDLVLAGEWWRLFTFAWVHNSAYHLALDGIAFLVLYSGLEGTRPARLFQLALCSLLSGVVPWMMSPEIKMIGLCGLSGVAHGLAVIQAFAATGRSPWIGWGLLLGVCGKTLFEVLSGNALFASWHLGNVGIPIATCHLGGVIGGLFSCAISKAAVSGLLSQGINGGTLQESSR